MEWLEKMRTVEVRMCTRDLFIRRVFWLPKREVTRNSEKVIDPGCLDACIERRDSLTVQAAPSSRQNLSSTSPLLGCFISLLIILQFTTYIYGAVCNRGSIFCTEIVFLMLALLFSHREHYDRNIPHPTRSSESSDHPAKIPRI